MKITAIVVLLSVVLLMAFVNTAEHFSSTNPELTMPSGSRDRPMAEGSPVYSSFYPRSTLYGVPFADKATTK
jgi:hypothetical protein